MLETVFRHPVAAAASALLLILIARFLIQGYKVRSEIHKLPGPPHSMIWGHLKVFGEAFAEVPGKVHPHVLAIRIKKYNLKTNYFYIDLWPLSDPQLQILDPDVAVQVTVDHVTPKHKGLGEFMIHLAGPNDLVSLDGPVWKKWRSIFNPGFAGKHLMSLTPGIVDDCVVFCKKMARRAEVGEVFRLEEDATRLTVDIIGKVALDLKLNTQEGENEMITAFREQVHLLPDGSLIPIIMYSPVGIYKRWKNDRIMKRYIGKVLEERFASSSEKSVEEVDAGQKKQRKRAIIDLAMDAYQAEQGQSGSGPVVLDAEFKAAAITQIRTFIFAGHDTTSSTIAWTFYFLHKHPECRDRIRKEYDEVLGSVDETPQKIKDDPYILNKLEYTMAVVKEVLRLFPPASSVRTGDPGFMIHDPQTGEAYPTYGYLVWVIHHGMHRNKAIWGRWCEDLQQAFS